MSKVGYIIIIKRSGKDGDSYPMCQSTCTIGKHVDSDIRVQLDTVSAKHARITVLPDGKCVLLSLSSTNPVQVNKVPLFLSATLVLAHKDEITIGDRLLRWEYAVSSPHHPNATSFAFSTPTKLAGLATPRNVAGSASAKKRKMTTPRNDVEASNKRKRVSFGPYLSPEQFDQQLPSSTPVRKGEKPNFSSPIPVASPMLFSNRQQLYSTGERGSPHLATSYASDDTPSKSLLRRRSPTPIKPYLARSLGFIVPTSSTKKLTAKSPKASPVLRSPRTKSSTPSAIEVERSKTRTPLILKQRKLVESLSSINVSSASNETGRARSESPRGLGTTKLSKASSRSKSMGPSAERMRDFAVGKWPKFPSKIATPKSTRKLTKPLRTTTPRKRRESSFTVTRNHSPARNSTDRLSLPIKVPRKTTGIKTPKRISSPDSLSAKESAGKTSRSISPSPRFRGAQKFEKTPLKVNAIEAEKTPTSPRKTPAKSLAENVPSPKLTPKSVVKESPMRTPKTVFQASPSPSKTPKAVSKTVPLKKTPKSTVKKTPSSKKSPTFLAKKTPNKSPKSLTKKINAKSPNSLANSSLAKETTKKSLLKTPEKSPESLSKKTPPKSLTKKTPKKSSDSPSKKTSPKYLTKKTPEKSPKHLTTRISPQKSPKSLAKKTPEKSSESFTKKTPDNSPKSLSKRTPKKSPKLLTKKTPKMSPRLLTKKTPKMSPRLLTKKTLKMSPRLLTKKTPKMSPKSLTKKTPKSFAKNDIGSPRSPTKTLKSSKSRLSAMKSTSKAAVLAQKTPRLAWSRGSFASVVKRAPVGKTAAAKYTARHPLQAIIKARNFKAQKNKALLGKVDQRVGGQFSQDIPKKFQFGAVSSTGHANSPAPIIIYKKSEETPKVFRKGRKSAGRPSAPSVDLELSGLDALMTSPIQRSFSTSPGQSPESDPLGRLVGHSPVSAANTLKRSVRSTTKSPVPSRSDRKSLATPSKSVARLNTTSETSPKLDVKSSESTLKSRTVALMSPRSPGISDEPSSPVAEPLPAEASLHTPLTVSVTRSSVARSSLSAGRRLSASSHKLVAKSTALLKTPKGVGSRQKILKTPKSVDSMLRMIRTVAKTPQESKSLSKASSSLRKTLMSLESEMTPTASESSSNLSNQSDCKSPVSSVRTPCNSPKQTSSLFLPSLAENGSRLGDFTSRKSLGIPSAETVKSSRRTRSLAASSPELTATELRKLFVPTTAALNVSDKKGSDVSRSNTSSPSSRSSSRLDLTNVETPDITQERFISPLGTPHYRQPDPLLLLSLAAKRTPSSPAAASPSIRAPGSNVAIVNPIQRQADASKDCSPIVAGMKQLFSGTKSPTADYRDVQGVKQLLRSSRTPKDDLRVLSGLKTMMEKRSPIADYTDVSNIKRLFASNHQVSLSDSTLESLKALINSPKTPESLEIHEVLNVVTSPPRINTSPLTKQFSASSSVIESSAEIVPILVDISSDDDGDQTPAGEREHSIPETPVSSTRGTKRSVSELESSTRSIRNRDVGSPAAKIAKTAAKSSSRLNASPLAESPAHMQRKAMESLSKTLATPAEINSESPVKAASNSPAKISTTIFAKGPEQTLSTLTKTPAMSPAGTRNTKASDSFRADSPAKVNAESPEKSISESQAQPQMRRTRGRPAKASGKKNVEPTITTKAATPTTAVTNRSEIPSKTTPIATRRGRRGKSVNTSPNQGIPSSEKSSTTSTPVVASPASRRGRPAASKKSGTSTVISPPKSPAVQSPTPVKRATRGRRAAVVSTPVKKSSRAETSPVKNTTPAKTSPVKNTSPAKSSLVKDATPEKTSPMKNLPSTKISSVKKTKLGKKTSPVKKTVPGKKAPRRKNVSPVVSSPSTNLTGEEMSPSKSPVPTKRTTRRRRVSAVVSTPVKVSPVKKAASGEKNDEKTDKKQASTQELLKIGPSSPAGKCPSKDSPKRTRGKITADNVEKNNRVNASDASTEKSLLSTPPKRATRGRAAAKKTSPQKAKNATSQKTKKSGAKKVTSQNEDESSAEKTVEDSMVSGESKPAAKSTRGRKTAAKVSSDSSKTPSPARPTRQTRNRAAKK